MKTYRLTLVPRSSFVTPLQSDTLFGHLCWAIRHKGGEARLTGFLGEFRGTSPPLLLSAAFPQGMLPVPALPPLSRGKVKALLESSPVYQEVWQSSQPAAYRHVIRLIKQVRSLAYVDAGLLGQLLEKGLSARLFLDLFLSLQACPLSGERPQAVKERLEGYQSPEDRREVILSCLSQPATCPLLYERDYTGVPKDRQAPACPAQRSQPADDQVIMRTQVDRLTWQGREGRLFDLRETFYRPGTRLTVWLRLADGLEPQTVLGWFQDVATGGYGRKASTGAGQFDLDSAGLVSAEGELPTVSEANAFMTLSAYVPTTGDPAEGYWRYRVKRGKLGDRFATDAAPGLATPHVWKFPLVMFEPGSLFRLPAGERLATAYGGLVPRMHPLVSEVVQYAYAFPVGLRLKDKEAEG